MQRERAEEMKTHIERLRRIQEADTVSEHEHRGGTVDNYWLIVEWLIVDY